MPLPMSMIMTQSANAVPCVRSALVPPALPLPSLRMSTPPRKKPTSRLPSTESSRYANVTLSPSSIIRCRFPKSVAARNHVTAQSLAEPCPAPLEGFGLGFGARNEVARIERRRFEHDADLEQLVPAKDAGRNALAVFET